MCFLYFSGYQTDVETKPVAVEQAVFDILYEELRVNMPVLKSDPLLSSVAGDSPVSVSTLSPSLLARHEDDFVDPTQGEAFYSPAEVQANPSRFFIINKMNPLHHSNFPWPGLREDLDYMFGDLPE
jgi:hypothetical protein